MSRHLRALSLAAAAVAVGAVCVFGGARLATQGAWTWGVALAALGGWTLFKAVRSYRAAVLPERRTGPDVTRPGDRRR